jgi:hypothetical protein
MSYVKPWWNCGWRWGNKTQFYIITYLFLYELESIIPTLDYSMNYRHYLTYNDTTQVFSNDNTAHFSLHPRKSFPLNRHVTNIKDHKSIKQSIKRHNQLFLRIAGKRQPNCSIRIVESSVLMINQPIQSLTISHDQLILDIYRNRSKQVK